MGLTIFDPRGIEPTAYKNKFPELMEIEEYRDLSYLQLIFIWWYANPSCPLVVRDIPHEQRVLIALNKSELDKKLPIKELNKYRDLQFPDVINDAIARTHKFNVGMRVEAAKMFESIFENYKSIKDIKNFTKVETDDQGQVVSSEVNYAEYLKISSLVTNALPGLIKKIEEGMGVVDTDGIIGAEQDTADDYQSIFQDKKRQQ